MATLVTATCGTDVVGWSPDGASAQQRVFELQHRARVSGTGWLPKGKALAVAGSDCVVNIYSMPDKKVAATVPKTTSLPSNPPVITALVLSQANVLYGCSDGSINMAKLPDVKVTCLCREEGQTIADVAVTPQHKLLAAASENGNVLLIPFERATPRTIRHLSCRDRDARCSLSVSSVGERIACGSKKGGIHIWDAASAAAFHFFQDGDTAVSIAFQALSQDNFFSASASKTMALWDCRTGKKSTQVDLVKPASSIAAGLTSHDVAIGDGVSVAWLYDMRRPETPRLRLPCGTSHAVTSIQWVPRPSSLDSRSHVNRRAGLSSSSASETVQGAPAPPSSTHLPADCTLSGPAEPSVLHSALPHAPPSLRDHQHSSVLLHRPLSQSCPASAAVRIASLQAEAQSVQHSKVIDDPNGADAPAIHVAAANSSMQTHVGDVGGKLQISDHGIRPTASVQSGVEYAEFGLQGQTSVCSQSAKADDQTVLPTVTDIEQRRTDAVKRVMDTHVAELHKRLDSTESRILSRILDRNAAEAPAYHTQQMNEHVHKTMISLKKEVQTWLCEYHEETLKQFHLAQQDLMDVAGALSAQMTKLTATVEQLQARIAADEENRRKVAQYM